MKKIILAFTLLALCCHIAISPVQVGAQTQQEIDENLSRLEQEIADAQSELSGLNERKSTLEEELQSLQNRIANTENLIQRNQESLEQIAKDVTRTQSEIESVNDQIRLIIRDIQVQSRTSPLEIMVSSQNVGDALSNMINYLNLQSQANDLRNNKIAFENQLRTRQSQEEEVKESLIQLTQILSASSDENKFLIAETAGSQAKYEEFIAAQQAEQEEWKNTVAVPPQPAPQPVQPDPPGAPTPPPPSGFIYPSVTASTTTSRCAAGHGYPACDFPTKNYNPTPPIFASKAGTVVKAGTNCANYSIGCNAGYGNFLRINHGDGTETLYAHLFGVFVGEGQSVSQGQQIGQMGCSGSSFGLFNPVQGCYGTHLHFEIRVNGVQQNPRNYIPIPWCESGNCN